MNIPDRKLGQPITRKLQITKDGKFSRKDNHSMEELIKAIYKKWSARSSCEINSDGSIDVCICTVKQMEEVERDALLHRSHGA